MKFCRKFAGGGARYVAVKLHREQVEEPS